MDKLTKEYTSRQSWQNASSDITCAYLCPKCKDVYSQESEKPMRGIHCPECDSILVYAKCMSDEWNKKTQDEKEKLKHDLLEQNSAGFQNDMLSCAQTIQQNIRTIKNILVFFTVLWVASLVILLIVSI